MDDYDVAVIAEILGIASREHLFEMSAALLARDPEAALRCLDTMDGGEVFVPKLRSSTVAAVARAVAPGSEFEVIGARAATQTGGSFWPTRMSSVVVVLAGSSASSVASRVTV